MSVNPAKKRSGLFMPLLYLRLPWMPVILFCSIMTAEKWKYVKFYLVLSILAAVLVNIFFVGSTVTSVIRCARLYETGEFSALRRRMVKVKFGSIPYFIINCILWLLFALLFLAASRGLIIFTPVTLLLLLPVIDSGFCVAATSIAAIAYALALRKQGRLTWGKTVTLIVVLFIFVADIIAVAVMAFRKKLRLGE